MTKNDFITRRTDAISNMLDNPDEHGIYPTTECFAALDDLYDELVKPPLSWAQEHRDKHV